MIIGRLTMAPLNWRGALLVAAVAVSVFTNIFTSRNLSLGYGDHSVVYNSSPWPTETTSSKSRLIQQHDTMGLMVMPVQSSLTRKMRILYIVDVRNKPVWQLQTLWRQFKDFAYLFVSKSLEHHGADDVFSLDNEGDEQSTWQKVHQHLQPSIQIAEWIVQIPADTNIDFDALSRYLATYNEKELDSPLILGCSTRSNSSETLLETPVALIDDNSLSKPLILNRAASRELAAGNTGQLSISTKPICAPTLHHCHYQDDTPYLIRPCRRSYAETTPFLTHETTVVTAFFSLNSKHSLGEYQTWMQVMLSIQDPVIVFVPSDQVELIRAYRTHATNRTLIIPTNLSDVPLANLYPTAFWEQQREVDPEKDIHPDYRLFWIWLSKSWFIQESVRLNPFQSDLFLWCDIGSLRHATDTRYEHEWLVRHPELVPRHSMLQMAHNQMKVHPNLFLTAKRTRFFFHSGSQAIGYHDTWARYHKELMISVNNWAKQGWFVGEDQMIMQHTCIRTSPLCLYVNHLEVEENNYFGLKYLLHFGGDYQYLLPPALDIDRNSSSSLTEYTIGVKQPENKPRRRKGRKGG